MALPSDMKFDVLRAPDSIYDTLPAGVFQADKRVQSRRTCSGCQMTPEGSESGARMVCSRCKSAWYCSQECQRKDWRTHKEHCISQEGTHIAKFLERLQRTPYLSSLLQVAIALCLDIPSGRVSPARPYLVGLPVGFEPDIETLLNMRQGTPLPKGTQGFFQINGILYDENITPSPARTEMWKKGKEQLARKGFEDAFIVVLEFRNRDEGLATSSIIHIMSPSIEIARKKEDFETKSALTGDVVKRPMNVGTTLEAFNTTLRHDTQNKFKMRKIMSDADIGLLQQAIDGEVGTSPFAIAEKWKRERVYQVQKVKTQ
ncbi:hypothetical protein CYLTODRAFT_442616 [Cylindrobasidium torrendii FP15055 ss-10]|uniref:MYND-type domain-containing protein n=1 Tax=Cylindrobasidium torrendii FP15055 ss-10 TaxID=1314674 RepID=A0A0D7BGH5_9AGAR|nr:hypothetical protein CYLTODRAFT_442616 [Cylindrobasidium torrendii FP15055 ss-10]